MEEGACSQYVCAIKSGLPVTILRVTRAFRGQVADASTAG